MRVCVCVVSCSLFRICACVCEFARMCVPVDIFDILVLNIYVHTQMHTCRAAERVPTLASTALLNLLKMARNCVYTLSDRGSKSCSTFLRYSAAVAGTLRMPAREKERTPVTH